MLYTSYLSPGLPTIPGIDVKEIDNVGCICARVGWIQFTFLQAVWRSQSSQAKVFSHQVVAPSTGALKLPYLLTSFVYLPLTDFSSPFIVYTHFCLLPTFSFFFILKSFVCASWYIPSFQISLKIYPHVPSSETFLSSNIFAPHPLSIFLSFLRCWFTLRSYYAFKINTDFFFFFSFQVQNHGKFC